MASAPACSACGFALRWIPEHSGWGCDRCRQFYPVQAQAPAPPPPQPGYGYAGAASAVPPGRAPGAKSKLPLFIGIGVAAAAGIGVALFLLLRGGGGGAESPDDVIKGAIAAVGKADVDALISLGDPAGAFEHGMSCKGEAALDNDLDPKSQTEELRDKFGDLVEDTKGLKIELVSSKEDEDEREEMEAGENIADGCKAKVKMRVRTYKLKLKVTDKDGKTADEKAEVSMLEIDGRYYLVRAPKVRQPSKDSGAMVDKLLELKNHMCACKDKACADKVSDELMRWSQEQSKTMSEEKPDEEAMKQVSDLITEYSECQMKAM